MEYVQEAITTLHDFGDAHPESSAHRAAVVVPLTERDHAGLAAERVFSVLNSVDPERVVVALQASAGRIDDLVGWLASFDVPLEVVWCNGPTLQRVLEQAGLDGPSGKGRDVWLALGVASTSEYIVVHDADATTYDASHVPKLLFPLTQGYAFSKAYYARVENNRLYGRLFRLLYRPLVEALAAAEGGDICRYLQGFRYALAGEFATTGKLARRLRMQRGWGLEVGTLGEVYRLIGADGTAQVDLGIHEHDHKAVTGPGGLSDMAREVTDAVMRVVAENGGDLRYETVEDRYRRAAEHLVDAYELDAIFNNLEFDRSEELQQIETYAEALTPLGEDTRLPAWQTTALTPRDVCDAVTTDLTDAATQSVDLVPRHPG